MCHNFIRNTLQISVSHLVLYLPVLFQKRPVLLECSERVSYKYEMIVMASSRTRGCRYHHDWHISHALFFRLIRLTVSIFCHRNVSRQISPFCVSHNIRGIFKI
jgi:hypothetical protein